MARSDTSRDIQVSMKSDAPIDELGTNALYIPLYLYKTSKETKMGLSSRSNASSTKKPLELDVHDPLTYKYNRVLIVDNNSFSVQVMVKLLEGINIESDKF